MHRIVDALSNIRMTTAIMALVIISIAGSIAAVSGVIYLNLRDQAIARSQELQGPNLSVAAMLLAPRVSGSWVEWSPQGGSLAFFERPTFTNNAALEAVADFTKQDVTIYLLDPTTKKLASATSSITVKRRRRLTPYRRAILTP